MEKIVKIVSYLLLIVYISGCEVYEQKDVEQSIYVNQQSLNLFIGDQKQLKASPTEISYNWKSEAPTVATVNSSGLVEAVEEGFTNIIVYHDATQTKVPITVSLKIPLEDILLSVDKPELKVGDKLLVTALPKPLDANNFSRFYWSSDNENVAIVNFNGEILALGLGMANITVTADDGSSKTFTVSVYRGINVALHKPVKVSSILAPQYAGENAVDGILDISDSDNRWVSESTNIGHQWIEIDLEDEYEINSLEFWIQAGWASPDFKFQKEVDGEWIDIFSETGNTIASYSRAFESTIARKVRLYFTKGSKDGIVRMYEMHVNAKSYK